jgi:hypothetical protein
MRHLSELACAFWESFDHPSAVFAGVEKTPSAQHDTFCLTRMALVLASDVRLAIDLTKRDRTIALQNLLPLQLISIQ